MAVRSEEQLYASLQRGMRATAELELVRGVLDTRRASLIANAVAAFTSKVAEHRMTERDALLFVASLAEIQRLQDDLETIARDGQRAAAQFNQ